MTAALPEKERMYYISVSVSIWDINLQGLI